MELKADDVIRSMEENPQDWEWSVCTLEHKPSGIEFWIDSAKFSITETWNGHYCSVVFSETEGTKVYKQFKKLESLKASKEQQKIIEAFEKKPVSRTKTTSKISKVPWLVIVAPVMTFLLGILITSLHYGGQ